ncbi:hypothetical protein BGZ76_003756 [Entomortierella beljakovae]|nr:hypothetical protein BGZ76_003756 [Entomortierella beljakovae]
METMPIPAVEIFEPFGEYNRSYKQIQNIYHSDQQTHFDTLHGLGIEVSDTEQAYSVEEMEEELELEQEGDYTQSEYHTPEEETACAETPFSSTHDSKINSMHPSKRDAATATTVPLVSDTDIIPSLPIVELASEETLFELFTASSEAFKASRTVSLTRGKLLFSNNESLLDEPLSVFFQHLRECILVPRFGSDAVYYSMNLIFKSLDNLWLSENESSASEYSLVKLIQLYTASSGLQGQEILLEPFHIELNLQETFLSHLNRLEIQHSAMVQPLKHTTGNQTSQDDALDVTDALIGTDDYTEPESAEVDNLDVTYSEGDQEEEDESHVESIAHEQSISVKEGDNHNDDSFHGDSTVLTTYQSEEPFMTEDTEALIDVVVENQADENEMLNEGEQYNITDIDVDSLACFDDAAYDNNDDEVETDPEEEQGNLETDVAVPGSVSSTTRGRKRSVEEMIDLLSDEFLDDLSPDHAVQKKANMNTTK